MTIRQKVAIATLWELYAYGHQHFLGLLPAVYYRVSPFRLKNLFAYKRNKANLDPFHMCFTISL
jgi:hypothetical protein